MDFIVSNPKTRKKKKKKKAFEQMDEKNKAMKIGNI
jgi:hypothetical protein